MELFIPAPAAWRKDPPQHREPVRRPARALPPIAYVPPRDLGPRLPTGEATELSPEDGARQWKLAVALLHGAPQ